MIKQATLKMLVAASFFACASLPLMAQGTFTVGSTSGPGADSGLTELTGEIVMTVFSGTTVNAPIRIQYNTRITNNSAAEIVVTGTGGLAGVPSAPSINSGRDTIEIAVPAGGTVGNLLVIRGVRVDLAGLNGSRATALVTGQPGTGNAVLGGQIMVNVIDRALPPIIVGLKNGKPLSYANGVPVNDLALLLITEGYSSALSSDVGVLGQTVPVSLRVRPLPALPPGARITYSARADSTTTASYFRTPLGTPETVPREDGTTDVLYEFVGAAGNAAAAESFVVEVFFSGIPPLGVGIVSFQGSLEPVGLAVPDDSAPSTDIPRYLRRFLPDEADITTGSSTMQFPFRMAAEQVYTGIAVTNPDDLRAKIVLTALDAGGTAISGQGIFNPVEIVMPRKGQFAKVASEVFGPGFNASSHGTIVAEANKPGIAGFYLQGDDRGPRLDGAIGSLKPEYGWIWPSLFREAPSPVTTLEMYNPGQGPATATLRLHNSSGLQVAQATQVVQKNETSNRDLRTVFAGIDLGSFGGGYVTGSADAPLIVRETFGNAQESNTLQGQQFFYALRFHTPHFAAGGGFSTELTIVNADYLFAANLTVTLMDENGNPVGIPGNPARVSIPARNQLIRTVRGLFPSMGPGFSTGYIQVDVDPFLFAHFLVTPALAGAVRFSAADGSGSSALPLFLPPQTDFVFSHVAQNLGYYTGIALLNASAVPADIVLEVFRSDGTVTGTYAIQLLPGRKIAKVLTELVPAAAGQLGGYVRVRATQPVTAFSLFGSNDGLSLGAIPAQSAGN